MQACIYTYRHTYMLTKYVLDIAYIVGLLGYLHILTTTHLMYIQTFVHECMNTYIRTHTYIYA